MVRQMAVILYDEDALQVLKSFRPYLGLRGNKMADLFAGFADLLSSESAQSLLLTLRNSFSGKIRRLFDGEEKKKTNPFTLFLILVLLVLSDFSGDPEEKGMTV